jgi:CubicO group peptidase (beta-lactamase class C family)
MKKLLFLILLLVPGLASVAQRKDPSSLSPGFNLQKKQLFPSGPGMTSDIIQGKPKGLPIQEDDNPIAPGTARDSYHSTTFDPTWAGRFQTVLDSVRIHTGMKGASLAVLVPGQGLLTCVTGISSPGVPVTTAMRFGIMSNTKLFTAVTLAKLQEQGILSLDDHLYQWLPTYPNVDSTTTIRQLLSHQSGIFDFWNDSDTLWNLMLADTSRFWTPNEILASIKAPHFAPGHGYRYSNTNYLLAGMVIEAATGNTWLQKMHEFILNPLTMDSTFAGVYENRNGPVSAEWVNASIAITQSPMTAEYTQINAAGAMLSTAQEMAEWYSALLGGTVVSGTSLQQILDLDPTSWYGLGIDMIFYYDHFAYNHTGGGLGYASFVWYDRQTHATLCLLMNDRNFDFWSRGRPLLDVLYREWPKKQNDAGISKIDAPWENICTGTMIPSVRLTNFGSTPLTSASIRYKIDGNAPAAFNWTGSLGSGDTIKVVLPAINAGAGFHTFTCYTAQPNGAQEGNNFNDTTKSNFIVNAMPALLSELDEGFEGTVFPPPGWAENSSTIFDWNPTPLAHRSGGRSAVKSNYTDGHIGTSYDLDLPLIHIAGGTHPILEFDYAYAMYPGYYGDSLQVLISTDCGTNWQALFNKGSLDLYTSPPTNDLFYPQSNAEWQHESFSLASYTGDLLIRFRDVCGWGNNLYLDDVKVSFPTGIADKEPNGSFNVYPNPTSDMVNISGLPVNSEIQISDLTGKLFIVQKTGNIPSIIDARNLRQGIYILKTAKGVKKIVKL